MTKLKKGIDANDNFPHLELAGKAKQLKVILDGLKVINVKKKYERDNLLRYLNNNQQTLIASFGRTTETATLVLDISPVELDMVLHAN